MDERKRRRESSEEMRKKGKCFKALMFPKFIKKVCGSLAKLPGCGHKGKINTQTEQKDSGIIMVDKAPRTASKGIQAELQGHGISVFALIFCLSHTV